MKSEEPDFGLERSLAERGVKNPKRQAQNLLKAVFNSWAAIFISGQRTILKQPFKGTQKEPGTKTAAAFTEFGKWNKFKWKEKQQQEQSAISDASRTTQQSFSYDKAVWQETSFVFSSKAITEDQNIYLSHIHSGVQVKFPSLI